MRRRALRPDGTEGCARTGASSGAPNCLRAGAAWAVRVGRRERRQRTRVVVASHLWWFWSFCALVIVRPASSPGALIELEQDPALAALVRNWDFSPGKRFGTEVLQRFSTSVHHPSPTPDGSFFLLAVFRRYLFRLTEDSVAMALHCCLGGSPAGFHVVFESDRHFRFSVSNKQVGFLIRSLKRITIEQFDVYFHLWHDGGANWVKEKIKWQKEENRWTIQTNRKNKRNSARKKVSFHHKLVQDSPITKSQPRELNSVIKIGSFYCPFDPIDSSLVRDFTEDSLPLDREFGTDSSQFNKDFHKGPRSSLGSNKDVPVYSVFQKLKSDLRIDENGGRSNCPMQYKEAINGNAPQGVRFIFPSNASRCCFRCLSPGHFVRDCFCDIRCIYCFNYGHKAQVCVKRRVAAKLKWVSRSSKLPSFMEPSNTLAEPSIQWVHGPNAPPVASASTVHSSNMKTSSLDTPLVTENQSQHQALTHSSGSVPSSSSSYDKHCTS